MILLQTAWVVVLMAFPMTDGVAWQFSIDSNRVHSFMDLHRNEFTRPVMQEIHIDAPVPD